MRVIYTAGVFDLLHHGHRHVLKESRKLGDRLVVGVVANADYKGITPVWPLEKRLIEVAGLPEVDLVLVQPGTDPSPVINRLDHLGLRPFAMTHGGDWDRLLEGHETLDTLGINWVTIPLVGDVSSTKIRGELDRLRFGEGETH
jgi:D-beta-D-heptose 7-phosphate kinase/D-beta-D-heptose 1-phosphate adenosyltransferase